MSGTGVPLCSSSGAVLCSAAGAVLYDGARPFTAVHLSASANLTGQTSWSNLYEFWWRGYYNAISGIATIRITNTGPLTVTITDITGVINCGGDWSVNFDWTSVDILTGEHKDVSITLTTVAYPPHSYCQVGKNSGPTTYILVHSNQAAPYYAVAVMHSPSGKGVYYTCNNA